MVKGIKEKDDAGRGPLLEDQESIRVRSRLRKLAVSRGLLSRSKANPVAPMLPTNSDNVGNSERSQMATRKTSLEEEAEDAQTSDGQSSSDFGSIKVVGSTPSRGRGRRRGRSGSKAATSRGPTSTPRNSDAKRRQSFTDVRQLSHLISSPDAVKNSLTPETLRICNMIASGLKEDDPGLVVQIIDFAAIRAALGLLSVPPGMQQGADEMGSYIQFRDWLIRSAESVPGMTLAQQAGGPLSTCWHHLNERQATHILYDKWKDNTWCIDLSRAGISVCLVLKIIGTGCGRSDMFILPKVFS